MAASGPGLRLARELAQIARDGALAGVAASPYAADDLSKIACTIKGPEGTHTPSAHRVQRQLDICEPVSADWYHLMLLQSHPTKVGRLKSTAKSQARIRLCLQR
jgi:hypothetical protein